MASNTDYYQTLGVSKNATEIEIKQAYRKQALKWHPDRHKDDKKTAEKRFKEINEAYQVLSNTEKRQIYDQYGHSAFKQGGVGAGQGPFSGFGRQGPFTYTYTSGGPASGWDFSDFGVGGFADPFDIFEQFFGGSPFGRRQPRKPVYSLTIDFMEAVKGVKKEVVIKGKQKEIKIPAGVGDGTRIRFSDMDVVVSVRKHKTFHRDGADIFIDMPISFADAALGTVIEVETIEDPVKLRVKPGTQPNSLVRLRGKGVPFVRGSGRGDQYVRLKVEVPTRPSRRQKELLEQLRSER